VKRAALAVIALLLQAALAHCQTGWTDEQKKEFLLKASISKTHSAPGGIAGTVRVTLTDGAVTHEASIASINITMMSQSSTAPPEPGFTDRCIYNVAAYELNRILKLNMVPVSISRKYESRDAVYTWWVDDALMTEKERYKKKESPLDMDQWNQQMEIIRVFDQLIYNMDRNLGNMVIDAKWRIWMIDHTRAFRPWKDLKSKQDLTRCDKVLLQRLRTLDQQVLKERLSEYLTGTQIDAIAARAKLIVKYFEAQVKKRGEARILYTWLPAD